MYCNYKRQKAQRYFISCVQQKHQNNEEKKPKMARIFFQKNFIWLTLHSREINL